MSQIDKELLALILNDVKEGFDIYEILAFKTFDDFFDAIDVQNAYEEDWEDTKDKYKPYYEIVYKELRED